MYAYVSDIETVCSFKHSLTSALHGTKQLIIDVDKTKSLWGVTCGGLISSATVSFVCILLYNYYSDPCPSPMVSLTDDS